MAFTYNNPGASDLEMVRFLIGDTDSGDAQFQDAEINAILADEARVYVAAAICADALAAKYARFSAVAESVVYLKLARQLRLRGGIQGATPYAGGISQDDIDSAEADTDRPEPYFKVGMMDSASGSG